MTHLYADRLGNERHWIHTVNHEWPADSLFHEF
jgi:hypothetical protein